LEIVLRPARRRRLPAGRNAGKICWIGRRASER
jgi:hypothetical protein